MPAKRRRDGRRWAVPASGALPRGWYNDEFWASEVQGRIVALLRSGLTGYEVARRVGVSSRTVERWKRKLLRDSV